jgi:hypothetical protein
MELASRMELIDKFCLEFETDNPQFDRAVFYWACMPEPPIHEGREEELTHKCNCIGCENARRGVTGP